MRIVLAIILLLPTLAPAASIKQQNSITCISDQSSLQGRHKEYQARKNSEKAKSWFSEWMMQENFGNMKSRVHFTWKPRTPKGPAIEIDTSDKAHNLIHIRSQTKSSLIVVTSASNPLSTESWTFVFNFEVETVIATRVQSNIGGVKGEVITYDCQFENLELGDLDTRGSFTSDRLPG
ncbi:MAG TPA: hypothetical protein VKB27_11760 [Gammaproteobacteria bacterium]|nr:hypothetical protein [Gammaproteobacteria bacterium]